MLDGGNPRRRDKDKLTPIEVSAWLKRHGQGKVSAFAKLSDGAGLFLTVTKGGAPVWRVKYRHGGAERSYSIGPYSEQEPGITLAAARVERERMRGVLRDGRDPVQAREVERAGAIKASGDTFEAMAREWLRKREEDWSGIHYEKSERAIERDVLPELGRLPMREITPAMVTRVIEGIAARGAVDTAGRVRQHVGGIFRLAQARGLCNYRENPAEPAREVLPKKTREKRRPAFLEWSELGDVLRGAERARLTPAVRIAHRLCAFTAARISNVVMAEWQEFHLEADPPMWIIPRVKMKARDRVHDHKVFLGATIATDLREWRLLTNGKGKGIVFPSPLDVKKHITREALEKMYRVTLKLEDRHTPHGWRAAFSTLARDKGDEHDKGGKLISAAFERDVVELALDHIHDTDVVRAYARGKRLQQRVRLMTWWDGELTRAQRGAEVVPFARPRRA